MFSVIFEVHPRSEGWDAYLGYAQALRPELGEIDGFVDNVRYRSLTREGWLLSLSSWRDEKAVVRWRTHALHHGIQEKGRSEVFLDYHLRVGQVTEDSRLPPGHALAEQRLDETEVGEGTTAMLIDAKRPPGWVKDTTAEEVARGLGLGPRGDGAGRVGRARCRADARRCHPAPVLARRGGGERLPATAPATRRRSPAPGAGGARLRDVRPPRGAAVLSGRGRCADDPFLIERGLAYRHDPAACEAFEAQGGGCRLDSRP